MSGPACVAAAGTVPWRISRSNVEVLLVHRPKYDDWSWPKGKLDPGETWAMAAARETTEETGLRVRLGPPLPSARYEISNATDKGRQVKEVRYWAATVTGGAGLLENEIDDIRWVTPKEAKSLLTYPRDLEQLTALLADGGPHRAYPLLIVRHAKAVSRKNWRHSERDWLRPLDEVGELQARGLADILRSYAVASVMCSPSIRCADTVRPFLQASPCAGDGSAGAAQQGCVDPVPVVTWADPLSEEGYQSAPHLLPGIVGAAARYGVTTALCSHGPVLPDVVQSVAALAPPASKHVRTTLRELSKDNLAKGEVTVVHLARVKGALTIVAIERHPPHPDS